MNLNANYIVLYPLSFEEFLYNVDKNIFNKLSAVKDIYQIDPSLNKTLFKYLYEYIIIGGMPSVVNNYIENGFVFENIRAEQNRIVDKLLSSLAVYYKKTEYKNIESILKIILPLLIRNNNKFKINDFGKSRRFSSFSKFIDITKKLHLVYTSYNIKEKSTEINNSSFNLYLFDTGLLGAFGNIPYSIYGDNLDLGNQFVLGLVKNYAATESFSSFILPIYNWSQNMSKVELFFINKNKKSLGIEIKNNKSGKLKSLDILHEVYPEAKLIRMNNSYPMDKGQIKVLPLYTIRSIIRNFSN
ncbi:MAG: hypothetical protein B6229_03885 [Spirochaetaceae bacterium 4572_7]|nr:MAG: hypothetical protein B6229_03885 [Spirochaetaceae bacterium 4572_7]